MDDKNNINAPVADAVTPLQDLTIEPDTIAAPIVAPTPLNGQPLGVVIAGGAPDPAPKSTKKRTAAIVVAAVAVVVLGGGSALAYNLYYQNEQKVVTDSIVNMMRAETVEFTASMTMKSETSDAVDVNVALSGASSGNTGQVDAKISAKISGKTYSVTAAGLIDDKSDLYFKVGDVKKIVDEFKMLIPTSSQGAIDDIVAKIDNTWIKVDAKDMKDVSEQASKTQTCMTDAIKKFQDDKAATKQVGDLYRKNKFIVVEEKLGSKDGSLGYVLAGDNEAAKAFALSLKDTDLYKDLNKCDDSFTIDEKTFDTDAATDAADTRIELWVDRWSHQITKLSIVNKATEGKTTTAVVFEPTFNKAVTIQTPKDSITVKQLQKDIEALSEKYSSSLYSPSYDYES